MVELHGSGILQDAAPPQIRFILLLCIRRVEEFIRRWTEPPTHQGEFVVQETRVEARDECTYTPRALKISDVPQTHRITDYMHQITP